MKEMYAQSGSDGSGAGKPRWIEGESFEQFWKTIWKSEPGRAWAASRDPQAAWLKERLAQRPFFLCDPWEPALQRRHFSQMWGQVFTRAYANPALEDLYWIHELTHWATADLSPSKSFAEWSQKWDVNEQRASCASEILAQGALPGILRIAIGKEPWAARFGALGGANPEDSSSWTPASRAAFEKRLAIRDGKEAPTCEDEAWFAGFGKANESWAALWIADWAKVDEGLAAYARALQSGAPGAARIALTAAGIVDQFPALPYAEQAAAFLLMDGNKLAPEAPFPKKSAPPAEFGSKRPSMA